MDYVLVKVNKSTGKRNEKMKKIITDKTLYGIPEALETAVEYSSETLIDEYEWYKLSEFSSKVYCLEFLKSKNDSTGYPALELSESSSISYICSCQNKSNEFYFQKVSKRQLEPKKYIHIGDEFKIQENSKNITINDYPNAIYIKDKDVLYFQKLEAITSIFKGIDELYKEASLAETDKFLTQNFIKLSSGFDAEQVNKPNRKRVALAVKVIEEYDEKQKEDVFKNIAEYCSNIVISDDIFIISNNHDLEILIYGLLQRFYTTADGRKKLIANSVKKFQ